jgi:hypothetical protein
MALRTDYKRNTPEYEDSMTCKFVESLVMLSKDTGIPTLPSVINLLAQSCMLPPATRFFHHAAPCEPSRTVRIAV